MVILVGLSDNKNKSNTGLAFLRLTTLLPEPWDFIRFVNEVNGHVVDGDRRISFRVRSHACDRRPDKIQFLARFLERGIIIVQE